jgi:ubiquinone/menaquinone biosynthesis C-methylase UbiE
MDHYQKIYANNAEEYHQMITVEDVDDNLSALLRDITSFDGKLVLDLGTGTGKIPLLVADVVKQIIGSDLNYPMLAEQNRVRQQTGGAWPLVNADNCHLPYPDDTADIVTVGWAIGHFIGWYPTDWQQRMALVLNQMERVARPGGMLIIMETMTTGATSPAPPTEGLAEYYRWLENKWGYNRSVIQTDYQFESVEDAVAKTLFFFGEELAQMIRENGWSRLPEWTGVWHKQV